MSILDVGTNLAEDYPFPPLPEGYRIELVAPGLKKPGCRISGPDVPSEYAFELFEKGFLTRGDLVHAGFFIFEQHALTHEIPFSGLLEPENRMQFLHQDGADPRLSHPSFKDSLLLENGVLGFQTPPRGRLKQSFTAIGDREEVIRDIARFSLWGKEKQVADWEKVQNIFHHLRLAVAHLGISKFDAFQYPRDVKSVSFDVQYRDLEDLNRFLLERGRLYLHRYAHNQLVLIDNVDTLHGRFRSDSSRLGSVEPALTVCEFYWDEHGKLVPCSL